MSANFPMESLSEDAKPLIRRTSEPTANPRDAWENHTTESTKHQELMLEFEKYHELYLKIHHVEQECEQQLHSMEERMTRDVEDMMQSYEAKLEEKTMLLNQFQDEPQQKIRKLEEYIKKQEVDTDIKICEFRMKYEQKLKEQKVEQSETTEKLRKRLQSEIENGNLEIENLKQEEQELQSQIISLENDITKLEVKIQNKDGIMQDKEKSIYDLTRWNSALNNSFEITKFSYELTKEELAAKNHQTEEQKEQIQEMAGELKEFHETNTKLELKIDELNLKLKAKDKDLHKEMNKVQDFGVLIQRFKADLHRCVECIQDPKRLKDNIIELYKCYVQPSDMVEKVAVDTDMQRENSRLREHYEKIITTMKKQISRDANDFQANNTTKLKENLDLLKEINDLRQELHTVRTQLHNYEKRGGFGGSWIWVDWEKRRSVVFHQRGDNSLSSACQRSDSRADALCHRKGPEQGFCVQSVITEEMIDLIVSMTNLHGRCTMRNWTGVDSTDLRAYMGLLILAGVYRSRGESTRCLWDDRSGRAIFRATMSLSRFHEIRRCVHISHRDLIEQACPLYSELVFAACRQNAELY
ncbi:unnamed protein product [Leuciscus chuanchicus]